MQFNALGRTRMQKTKSNDPNAFSSRQRPSLKKGIKEEIEEH